MIKTPRIILRMDGKEDLEDCLGFVGHNFKENPRYIKWFLPDDILHIFGPKVSRSQLRKRLTEYVRGAYRINRSTISDNVEKAEKDWRSVEKRYFTLVNKIFKNHLWPKGPYVGTASIFMMYPRNIRDKTFFFPGIVYSKGTPPARAVIGHEVLHFMFFDYIEKKYSLKVGGRIKGKPKDYLWQISEVFNSVIEDWEPYYHIFKFKTPPYVGKEFYAKMRRQWVKNPDIDKLLDGWLK